MFSVADMAVAGAVALIMFGPDQLPKVARKAGQIMRDVQNTSQSFIRELERAADEPAPPSVTASNDLPASPIPGPAPLVHEPAMTVAEPAPAPDESKPVRHVAEALDHSDDMHTARIEDSGLHLNHQPLDGKSAGQSAP